jgi:hypothetical protein
MGIALDLVDVFNGSAALVERTDRASPGYSARDVAFGWCVYAAISHCSDSCVEEG